MYIRHVHPSCSMLSCTSMRARARQCPEGEEEEQARAGYSRGTAALRTRKVPEQLPQLGHSGGRRLQEDGGKREAGSVRPSAVLHPGEGQRERVKEKGQEKGAKRRGQEKGAKEGGKRSNGGRDGE